MAMKSLIEGFPQQLITALEIANKASLTPAEQPIYNVFIAGMGGSGIGGQLVKSFTYKDIKVPISTAPTYDIPSFVNKNTLFIACSFSGNTEETLTGLKQALDQKAKIVAITSGGKLDQQAKENNFDVIHIPGESKSPRASIGYSFVQLLKIFQFHGLTSTDYSQDFKEAIYLLKDSASTCEQYGKQLAGKITGKLPIIYSDYLLYPLAVRIQQQINENGKHFAHANFFPEMNHNELVGWKKPDGFFKDTITFFLKSDFDHRRTQIRMDICEEIFRKEGAEVVPVGAQGNSLIAQMMYINHIFDWVSFYLAEENGVDPFPVEVIDYLKSELAKR